MGEVMLDIEGLEVTFHRGGDTVHAVRGISLAARQGESFGIVGESGSGKSTVLRAICGLAPTSAGAIRLNGQPLAAPRSAAFYREVQMVFQDPYGSLHPRHTVDRVLSEPLAIHGFDRREERIEQALADVGLGQIQLDLFRNGIRRTDKLDLAPDHVQNAAALDTGADVFVQEHHLNLDRDRSTLRHVDEIGV